MFGQVNKIAEQKLELNRLRTELGRLKERSKDEEVNEWLAGVET